MAYATVLDVGHELGREITDRDEQAQVNRWIARVELLISQRLGPLDRLNPEALRAVVPAVVARKALNPTGKQNERIDDYSYGLSTEAASVDLMLTDLEWEMLTPEEATVDDGAFNIRPGGSVGRMLDTERSLLGGWPW